MNEKLLLPFRMSLLLNSFGYGLDYVLTHYVLASSGIDSTMRMDWSGLTENPHMLMAALSVILLLAGHISLIIGCCLCLKTKGGADTTLQNKALHQFYGLAGLVGGLGFFSLILKQPILTGDSFTYVETMGVDVMGVLAMATFCLTKGLPNREASTRTKLLELLIATLVVGGTIFANTGEQAWWLFFFGTGLVVILVRGSQLLTAFAEPEKRPSKVLDPGAQTLLIV